MPRPHRYLPLALVAFSLLAPRSAADGQEAAAGPPPPGRLVDVGGHRLHLHCLGHGTPTVVLDAGIGGWSIALREIQERIAGTTRACAYDRAGYGWSDPGPEPRTAGRAARELLALLERGVVPGPYVLVGHSFGGYVARLAHRHDPEAVAGIVLAESAHEEQWDRLPEEARRLTGAAAARSREAAAAARTGALPDAAVPTWEGPPELAPAWRAAFLSPSTHEATASEMESAFESARQVAETGDLGSLPLAVVTARNSFDAFAGSGIPLGPANEAWLAMQEELVALSETARWFVSESGDHRLHRTDPELLVEAIEWAVAVARRRASGAAGPTSPMPDPADLRVLPRHSDPATDRLLAAVERAYEAMEVEGFVALFSRDFSQVDVNRRVHVAGIDAWRRQTERVNAAHRAMARIHHGRARVGDWIVAEIQWTGTVRGEALGSPGEDRAYDYSGIGLLEVDDGRIRRQILWADVRTLTAQLGESVLRGASAGAPVLTPGSAPPASRSGGSS